MISRGRVGQYTVRSCQGKIGSLCEWKGCNHRPELPQEREGEPLNNGMWNLLTLPSVRENEQTLHPHSGQTIRYQKARCGE